MGKLLSFFNMGYKFVKKAQEAGVLESILKAIEDKKLTYVEMIDIATKLCIAYGIELDKKGIKL